MPGSPRRPRSPRPLRATPVVGAVVRWLEERLTARGRFVLWSALVLGLMGVDTRRTQIYALFAGALGLSAAARLFVLAARPRARLECALPARATAGAPLALRARLVPEGGRPRDLCL